MRQNYHVQDRIALAGCLRQIFDAVFWKRWHQQGPDQPRRWCGANLSYVWIALALSARPGLVERFEEARAWTAQVFAKRKRPGTSYQGFVDASLLHGRELLETLRQRLQVVLQRHSAATLAWPLFAVDGSRVRVPHTLANEAAFGLTRIKNRADSAPQLLVVAAVEMSRKVMWDWEVEDGNASEPELAARILRRLPAGALIVKDAGAVSHAWLAELLRGRRHILMRVAGNFRLWAAQVGATLERGGEVWLHDREQRAAPLRLRLIAVHSRAARPVYLLTDLPRTQVSDSLAGELYRQRWGASEIGFRSFKQTLSRTVLLARSPEMAVLECHYSLLGMQLLGALHAETGGGPRWSLARTWRVWRTALTTALSGPQLRMLVAACVLDGYKRRNPKSRRRAPHKKPWRQLGPPNLRRLTVAVRQRWTMNFPALKLLGF